MTPDTLNQKAGELFQLFPQLAARVTHLRTIIQNPEIPLTKEDKLAWIQDVRSTLEDFMNWTDQTKALISHFPSHKE